MMRMRMRTMILSSRHIDDDAVLLLRDDIWIEE